MSDVTCRGSFALGTACGKCSKCKDEMSRHKEKDGPELEAALALHGLPHDKPSQLADAFRCGWNRSGDALSALQEQNRALREENEAMKAAIDADLSASMVAAGIVPLDATTKPDCLTRFHVHAGMTDLQFFGEWVERKAREYTRMQAAHQTGERVMKDDISDFVMGKAGAFKEVLDNFRAATKQEGGE